MNEEHWIKKPDSIRLSEEPYPSATIVCTRCDLAWADTEDPLCNCDEDNDHDVTT